MQLLQNTSKLTAEQLLHIYAGPLLEPYNSHVIHVLYMTI